MKRKLDLIVIYYPELLESVFVVGDERGVSFV